MVWKSGGRVAKAKGPTRTQLKERCDRLFSLRIRLRGSCEICGKRPPEVTLQCAHIFSRRYMGTRWDFRNALCLCAGCHFYYTHRPIDWEDKVKEMIGEELYEEVRLHARAITKPDYDAILAYILAK